jgi:hypothetical protein
MKNSLDCPVPRLTLLFFGAAKDVPEAAEMVTSGTAYLQFLTASQRPNMVRAPPLETPRRGRRLGSNHAATPDSETLDGVWRLKLAEAGRRYTANRTGQNTEEYLAYPRRSRCVACRRPPAILFPGHDHEQVP